MENDIKHNVKIEMNDEDVELQLKDEIQDDIDIKEEPLWEKPFHSNIDYNTLLLPDIKLDGKTDSVANWEPVGNIDVKHEMNLTLQNVHLPDVAKHIIKCEHVDNSDMENDVEHYVKFEMKDEDVKLQFKDRIQDDIDIKEEPLCVKPNIDYNELLSPDIERDGKTDSVANCESVGKVDVKHEVYLIMPNVNESQVDELVQDITNGDVKIEDVNNDNQNYCSAFRNECVEDSKFKCNYCHRAFLTHQFWKDHGTECNKNTHEQTELCRNVEYSKSTKNVSRMSLKLEKKGKCHKRNTKVISKESLTYQNRLHTSSGQHVCAVCGKQFTASSSLATHALIHTIAKPHKCTQCEKVFAQADNLMHHMRIHTVKKPYKCPQCEKAFTRAGHVKCHMLIHTGEKPHKCTQCEWAFAEARNLKYHMRIHTREKPYKCMQCENAFSLAGDLKRHMRIHTGEKPYPCTQCDEAFARPGHLKCHMMVHTGEKPYKCTLCEKTFAQAGHLKRHITIHTGEKPHKCTQCKQAFAVTSDLIRHMRIHTGEKPYECTHCEKAFVQAGHLKRHMRTLHKNVTRETTHK